MSTQPIAIIGAGLQGLTTALALQQRGEVVRVLERAEGTALETSYANAGMLTPSQVDPWNSPGVGRHLLQSIGRDQSAMLLRLGALPSLMGWGLSFLRHSTPNRHRQATRRAFALARHSIELTAQIREKLGIDYDASTHGTLKVFRSDRAFAASIATAEFLGREGMIFEALDADGGIDTEPQLAEVARELVGGLRFPDDECGDAHLFCRRIAAEVEERGGRIDCGVDVRGLECRGGRVTGLHLEGELVDASRIVVAAGSWSVELLRSAGLRLPVRPAKGYSLTLDAKGIPNTPRIAVVDDTLHTAIVPLGDRLRIAGTAEFAGFDKRVRAPRIRNLSDLLQRVYPSVAARADLGSANAWAGLRPMSSDGLPFIGPTRIGGLFVNSGHGHLGWTMAMGSADLLADLMVGKPTAIDPSPYLAQRAL